MAQEKVEHGARVHSRAIPTAMDQPLSCRRLSTLSFHRDAARIPIDYLSAGWEASEDAFCSGLILMVCPDGTSLGKASVNVSLSPGPTP